MRYETSIEDLHNALAVADDTAGLPDRELEFAARLRDRGLTIVDRQHLVNLEVTEDFQEDTEMGIITAIVAGIGAGFGYWIGAYF